MEDIVYQIIKEHQKNTNKKCGISVASIKNQTDIEYKELKNILKKLFENKKIKVREGINSKLIFIK